MGPQNNQIDLISIRGERHSGTNWLRQLILENCPKLKFQIYSNDDENTEEDKKQNLLYDADGKYGWKHGLLHDNFDQLLDQNDVLLVIFRDWRSWLPKMRSQNYQPSIHHLRNHLPWPSFLREKYPANAEKWVKSYDAQFSP